MHLTSETSKSTGVKTGRIKANDSSEKWKGYLHGSGRTQNKSKQQNKASKRKKLSESVGNEFLWTFSSVIFGLFYRTKPIVFPKMRIDRRNPCSSSITEIKETQTKNFHFMPPLSILFVPFCCKKGHSLTQSRKLLVFKWKFPSVDDLSIKRGENVHTGVKISHIGSFNQNNLTIFSEMRKKVINKYSVVLSGKHFTNW